MRWVAVLCLGALAGTAAAETDAERLFSEGRALLGAGRAAQACEAFERSFRLDPTASGTMLNLGLCHEVLGKLSTALRWFRRAQVRASESAQGEVLAIARERAMELASKVASLTITSPDPAISPRVTLDGEQLDPAVLGRVEVDAGKHVLRATAAGYRDLDLRFEIADGEARAIEAVFQRVEAVTAPVPRPRSRAPLVLAISGGSLWALSAGLVLYQKYGVYDPAREEFARTGDPAERDRANRARSIVRWGGTGMFAAGAIALGVAGVLWLRGGDEDGGVAIVPALTPDGGAIGIAGAWR